MKKNALWFGMILCSLLLVACGRTTWEIPRCELLGPGTCTAYLPPFDHAGWWEANMMSKKLRGRSVLPVGCTYGGCSNVTFNYDFTKIQEDAEIKSAMMYVLVLSNHHKMANSMLEGRMNVAEDFAVIADKPIMDGDWAVYDVTQFVCRAVLQRRNSTTVELSLPAAPCEAEQRPRVATVALSWDDRDIHNLDDIRNRKSTEPHIIIKYR